MATRKTKSGKIDMRTKEGKAAAAKKRKEEASLINRIKRFFK